MEVVIGGKNMKLTFSSERISLRSTRMRSVLTVRSTGYVPPRTAIRH